MSERERKASRESRKSRTSIFGFRRLRSSVTGSENEHRRSSTLSDLLSGKTSKNTLRKILRLGADDDDEDSKPKSELPALPLNLSPVGEPRGCLMIQVRRCRDFTKNVTVKREMNLMIRITIGDAVKCTTLQSFREQVSNKKPEFFVKFDEAKFFSVEVPRQHKDERAKIYVELVAFETEMQSPRLLGKTVLHLFEVIQKLHSTELYSMAFKSQAICKVELKIVFLYGSLGYGYSHQLKEPQKDIHKNTENCFFMRIPPPQNRTLLHFNVLTALPVDCPQFLSHKLDASIGSEGKQSDSALSLEEPFAMKMSEKVLQLLQSSQRLQTLKGNYNEKQTMDERIEFLQSVIMKKGPRSEKPPRMDRKTRTNRLKLVGEIIPQLNTGYSAVKAKETLKSGVPETGKAKQFPASDGEDKNRDMDEDETEDDLSFFFKKQKKNEPQPSKDRKESESYPAKSKKGSYSTKGRKGSEHYPTKDQKGSELYPIKEQKGSELYPTKEQKGSELYPTKDQKGSEHYPTKGQEESEPYFTKNEESDPYFTKNEESEQHSTGILKESDSFSSDGSQEPEDLLSVEDDDDDEYKSPTVQETASRSSTQNMSFLQVVKNVFLRPVNNVVSDTAKLSNESLENPMMRKTSVIKDIPNETQDDKKTEPEDTVHEKESVSSSERTPDKESKQNEPEPEEKQTLSLIKFLEKEQSEPETYQISVAESTDFHPLVKKLQPESVVTTHEPQHSTGQTQLLKSLKSSDKKKRLVPEVSTNKQKKAKPKLRSRGMDMEVKLPIEQYSFIFHAEASPPKAYPPKKKHQSRKSGSAKK
ncbi:cation channel sperm-associated targeting subunit tau [Latimeria chalumnae]|uniref:cation channel sperm-associated targeting subunit tau n=1 Tax=Latimeria chalumnae TaxID=7897 RepID=UPI0006D8FD44|nr:PREDICTED: amyotrophic lateral sclerosis 2 chromosomal region candidate gene 11 protein isoform X2 [Latimeria chalumnae]XP_014343571.1 PREDICTED: amyotrophic lateral sclerosis 2 chromosomal region candidate gene 11 protein isoform X3 [Latimeria chalumnae]|eukprot:XP_014343570.1 PREDICTED: amyotrophic lateral sclerosis 2 chromosomal region candidate gene 11 protein isoform X2 [Latimeria chalumnae]